MKISILGTGLSGLVGSRIVELLSGKYNFEDLSFDTGIDITDKTAVLNKFTSSKAVWVLHLAAKTDVNACQIDKELGKKGNAWNINVEGTRNIVNAAAKTNKRVLFISSDFVFSGKKDFYQEQDLPDPINWYGVTKYEGEKITLKEKNNLVVRITYPYRAKCLTKKDFVHKIKTNLEESKVTQGVTDMIFAPTFIDDIAFSLDLLISQKQSGIYHVVGNSLISPYMAALEIAHKLNLNKNLIQKTTAALFYKNVAPRPLLLRTKNDKIKTLGFVPKSFSQGLDEIIKQGIL
ncbi:MAG: dTDP-4-dehydrorhamnose reductase [Candidatus Gottesmanbacteria bacterium GW2011_GWA1_34_13]|uniref:dTDP-4-dehydrorhamnose reductase n=1 Tax=Candidatus Gottesmanbacteria bacterium GW2011_GWA1_34_13 TaxID=1618434 RepID=A0A0G0DX21_9BACT|nr:MAG: dTDP-4-dehydrorhamnose reductase [Candidatus Gottesmanbacteria bacterium GW2011_GWA1_34_13]